MGDLTIWSRDHSVYAPSQWEMALHCNAISHWLGAYTRWSLLAYLKFCRKHFQLYLHDRKLIYFVWNASTFTEVSFQGCKLPQFTIGIGLVPNGQQAIIWTKDCPAHWCTYSWHHLNHDLHYIPIIDNYKVCGFMWFGTSICFYPHPS